MRDYSGGPGGKTRTGTPQRTWNAADVTVPGDELTTLLAQARAGAAPQRIEAGTRLARFADEASAAHALILLLLDPDDAAVTGEVAAALLAREDDTGVRLVVAAVRRGDEQVGTAVMGAVTDCAQTWAVWLPFRRRLRALVASEDEETAAGAQRLVDLIKRDAAVGFEPFAPEEATDGW